MLQQGTLLKNSRLITKTKVLYLQYVSLMDVVYRESQLGYNGEIADDFSVLIRALWSGQYKCITPRDFKVCIPFPHTVEL